MVRLGPFELLIKEGVEKDTGYVELCDKQTYTLTLASTNSKRCRALVKIDGKEVGAWQLEPFDRIILERPADSEKLFTFFKTSTAPSGSGIKPRIKENGLVQVTFTPEKYAGRLELFRSSSRCSNCEEEEESFDFGGISFGKKYQTQEVCGVAETSYSMYDKITTTTNECSSCYSEGATALTGHSDQKFKTVSPLNLDYDNEVTLSLRLVINESIPVPLVKVTPLKSRLTTPIPEPVYN